TPPEGKPGDRSYAVRPSLGQPDEAEGSPELTLGGSKTLTVEIGSNRDLSLKQTLDLQINGRVSKDVTLRAILSDRDLPFQPEGSSAELEELDKVLIEIEAPGAKIGFGDQDLVVQHGSLGQFSRRLQGLLVDGQKSGGAARLVGAAQRGEFRTYEFLGTEGKQGPYPLVDRAGGRGIVVVAGSERIQLDGELLVRGLDNDYIIDYSRAELTFTARRSIGQRSRIAADYEFAAGGYRRSLYLADGKGSPWNGALQLGLVVSKESDDRGRPLGGELSDAEEERLAAAGDSVLSGGGGIRFVGEGNGRYTEAFDAVNSRTFYRWVGRGEGRLEITFVNVGEGIGDYADSLAAADTIYVYRGPAGGRFAPAGALTAPVQQSFGQVDGRWRLADRGVLDGEFALSTLDRNTFSSQDDDDNAGNAGRIGLDILPIPLAALGRSLGELSARAEHRHLGENFSSPGRIDPSFTYDRDWNLPTRAPGLAEDRTSGLLTYRPVPEISLRGDLARLSGSGRSADRRLLSVDATGRVTATGTLLVVDSAVDTARAEGRLERQTARVVSRVRFLVPSVRYEAEERVDPIAGVGTRYRLAGGDLGIDAVGPLRLSIGAERRVDDRRSAAAADSGLGWLRDTDAVTRKGSLSLTGWKPLSATLLYQARDVERPEGGTISSDLAQFDLTRRSSDAAFAADLHYQVGTNGVERRMRTLVFVGEGMGSFDQFGNLVPGGGFDLVEGPLGPEEVITDVDLSLRLELVPYRARPGTGLGGWLRKNLGWNANARVEERSRLPLGRLGHLLDLDAFQNPESSLGGRAQLRQSLEIFPSSKIATLKLTQEADDIANYQFTNFREDRTESIFGAGVRWTPSRPWTLELTQKAGTRAQTVVAGGEIPQERRARVSESLGQLTWRPTPVTRFVLATAWRRESVSSEVLATALDLNPRLSWSIGARGRLEANGRWISADRRGGYTGIGGFSTLALRDRLEIGVDGDWRLLDVLTVSGGLAGRRPEGARFVLDARMEVRAYF
ncbi:MAG: hypothetical protein SGI90_07170, partial [Candidatus Eisenbacteria bacterium]|nr:hypothetical protein [Candidatus Eisenbacteria bacterium]